MNAHALIVSYRHDPSDPSLLLSTYRATSQDRRHSFRKLELDWPFAPSISIRLSELMTGSLCAGNQKLLYHCLDQGLTHYEQAQGQRDDHRLRAFCCGLVDAAARSLSSISVCTGGGEKWTLKEGSTLKDWLNEQSVEHVEIKLTEGLTHNPDRIKQAEEVLRQLLLTDRVRAIIGGSCSER